MSILTMPRTAGNVPAPNAATGQPPHVTVAEMFRRWRQEMAKRRAVKKAAATLMALDDRMLKDIGLDRSEIFSALTEGDRPAELRHRRTSLFE